MYFLNPVNMQETGWRKSIRIFQPIKGKNIFVVEHKLFFPFQVKFHWNGLFQTLMRLHIGHLQKKMDVRFQILWSFDIGNFFRLKHFLIPLKIFFPVDEPLNKAAIASADDADIVFSVTSEILSKYDHLPVPKVLIGHGVAEDFLEHSEGVEEPRAIENAGISGNLTRKDIDWPILFKIIEDHPEIKFNFWGPYRAVDSNIGGIASEEVVTNISRLRKLDNVILHGVISTAELARAYRQMDVFLICYDVNKDQSKGTNYHKVLEFLSTGKVIVSNNITSYSGTGLVEMLEERSTNTALPALFNEVIKFPGKYNSNTLQMKRKRFASDNTYLKQVNKIELALNKLQG